MSSLDVTLDLFKSILSTVQPTKPAEWVSVAAVLNPNKASTVFPIGGAFTYVYASDGSATGATLDSVAAGPALRAYMDSYYGPDEAWPVQLLLQFDRASGQYEVTFEETDATRWKITPARMENVAAFAEELRPKF